MQHIGCSPSQVPFSDITRRSRSFHQCFNTTSAFLHIYNKSTFSFLVLEKKSSKHKKKKQKKEKEDKEKKKKKKHHHHHHHSEGGAEESVQNGTVEEDEPLPVSWNPLAAAAASASFLHCMTGCSISLSAHVKLQTARRKLVHQDGEWRQSSLDPLRIHSFIRFTVFSYHETIILLWWLLRFDSHCFPIIRINMLMLLWRHKSVSDQGQWSTCLILSLIMWCLGSLVSVSPIHNQVLLL